MPINYKTILRLSPRQTATLLAAAQAKVYRARLACAEAGKFTAACYRSAFGDTACLIEWHGIRYIADRSDYYAAEGAEFDAYGDLQRAEEELADLQAAIDSATVVRRLQADAGRGLVTIGDAIRYKHAA
jgi:hypothetical protein